MSSIFFGLAAAIICFSVLIFGIKKASELEYMTDEERQKYRKNLWVAVLFGWIFAILAFISD